jgi:hypothetical protein
LPPVCGRLQVWFPVEAAKFKYWTLAIIQQKRESRPDQAQIAGWRYQDRPVHAHPFTDLYGVHEEWIAIHSYRYLVSALSVPAFC